MVPTVKNNTVSSPWISFTKMKDLVICKAFILTSEYEMSQNDKQFQDLMSMTYDKLIKNQFREDKCSYNKAP